MDPLGLLQAAIAVALYPGGVFLLGIAMLAGLAGRLPRDWELNAVEAAGVLAATVGASLAPLPGSVLSTLPPSPGFGPAPNLAAAIVLEAAAIALVAGDAWSRRRTVAAAAPLVPLLLLSAAAATLSLPTLVALPGALVVATRALIAGSLLTAAPLLLLCGNGQSAARTVVLAGIAILAAAIALEPAINTLPGPAAAAAVAAATVLYGFVVGRVRRLGTLQTGLTVFAAMQGAAAVATILVARA